MDSSKLSEDETDKALQDALREYNKPFDKTSLELMNLWEKRVKEITKQT